MTQIGQEMVDLWIVIADEVEFLRMSLAGVPDGILVEVVSEPPAQDDGIKLSLVHKALEQHRPLVDFDLHLDPDLLEIVLNKRGDVAADFITVICQQGEGETLAILHADSIGSRLPTYLIQQGRCSFGIVGQWLNFRVIEPHLRSEDAVRLHSVSVDDVLDHLWDVYGLRECLAHAEILEHRPTKIPADVVVHVAC